MKVRLQGPEQEGESGSKRGPAFRLLGRSSLSQCRAESRRVHADKRNLSFFTGQAAGASEVGEVGNARQRGMVSMEG